MALPQTIEWGKNGLVLLDQRTLPEEVRFFSCTTAEDVARAIETMVVRGAPAIGIAAAYGLVLESSRGKEAVFAASERLRRTRPTAVNLFWALDRMTKVAEKTDSSVLPEVLLREAHAIFAEDLECCRSIGKWGASLLPPEGNVITHCNAGALATAGHGTALGVIRSAWEEGKKIQVYADETRPVLQGARLTLWELEEDSIPVTLITDGMGAFLMARKKIDAVVVGADRITAEGDVANKIGTYALALAARHHGVPSTWRLPGALWICPSGAPGKSPSRNGIPRRCV
ncbi:MAG TPA: S-methyl-5-thioribose-1-phosphate isomerase, partial [Synergistaceae bacterium]|nr:S-methyl-5-thioribose-1-phosphate isomerase [Synergistaceae bacterium]